MRTSPPRSSTLFPYTTLFRSMTGDFRLHVGVGHGRARAFVFSGRRRNLVRERHRDRECRKRLADLLLVSRTDRKSTRLNSSHVSISYAVFCLKKKNTLP